MPYTFGKKSAAQLQGVHPGLVAVMAYTLHRSPVDFGILEGVRTMERQRQLASQGKTRTLNSKHLTGHAVDLVAYVDGKASWDLEPYQTIADVVQFVASEVLGQRIRWGGAWDACLSDSPLSALDLHLQYCSSIQMRGGVPFVDAGHFELIAPT